MLEPWMLTQAHEYMTIKARVLQGMNIKIHGDGLIAWCIETGIDLDKLITAARRAETIIGAPLMGRVMHSGGLDKYRKG